MIAKNGTNLLSNSFFAGMGIVVFDPKTLEVDTSAWYQLFNQPTNVQALADLINSIPNGKLVAMGVADDARNNLSSALKNAIKTLGSTKIDSLQFRGSWALIGKKGSDPGEVIEQVRGPYDGSILIDSNFVVPNKAGSLTTNIIGPAAEWKNLSSKAAIPSNSKINYKILGLSTENKKDSLASFENIDSVSLGFVDSKKYPFLEVITNFSAADDGVHPL